MREFVRDVLRAYEGPVLVDADGLNALAGTERIPRATDLLRRSAPVVVTPHPGEMARLAGVPTAEVQRRRLETARAFARGDGRGRGLEGPTHGRGAAGRRGLREHDREPGHGDRRHRRRPLRNRGGAPGSRPRRVDGGGRRRLPARGRGGRRRPSPGGGVARRLRHPGFDPDACCGAWGALIPSVVTRSTAETEQLAADLAARFRGGEVVLLSGELGAGKTAFVRGLARGLGSDPEEVASPTFVLLTAYPGPLTLHHADLYRLAGNGDERELGLEELPGPRGVLAIEWAERLPDPPWSAYPSRPSRARGTGRAAGDDRGAGSMRRGVSGSLCLAVLAMSCRGGSPPPRPSPTPALRTGNGLSVLLITIDTLRADHLGVYGYARPTSPHIDALAQRGTVFDRAFTFWPKTRGSFVMMMTGRRPSQNGYSKTHQVLLDFNPTLAAVLGQAGYRTAAVLDNPNLAAQHGYARGFESYRETWEEPALDTETARVARHHGRRDRLSARGTSRSAVLPVAALRESPCPLHSSAAVRPGLRRSRPFGSGPARGLRLPRRGQEGVGRPREGPWLLRGAIRRRDRVRGR